MSYAIVYPQGRVKITVPATESVAVYTKDSAIVSREQGYPNVPPTTDIIGTVNNTQTVFGAYASGATIIIEAGASPVLYAVGVAPVVDNIYGGRYQPDPVALNATGAVTAAAILGGIVTSTTGAAVAGTIPTGTVMEAASDWAIGDAIDWSVINTGGNTFTVTAATDHTIVGVAAVVTVTSGRFRTRKTATNTFVTYRIA